MKSQKLAGFLKSRQPFIIIAIAVLAVVAAALISNRRASDEPTPASAAPPAPTPSPPADFSSWGPAYSGGEITLSGGRTLQLSSDVYIAGRIGSVYCGPIVNNTPPPCPPAPLYTLKRGDSVVLIDADCNIAADKDDFRPSDFTDEAFADFFAIDENDVWNPAAFPFIPAYASD